MGVTDLKLDVDTLEGRKARIIASGLVGGEMRTVTLAHGFGNRGAAVNYLRQNEPMLLDRARNWLFDPSIRPALVTTRRLLREEMTERFGSKLLRLLLTGSRARGNSRPDSDWDIVAVVEDTRRCGLEGPIAKPLQAPDGNPVDLIVIPPADFDHPARFMAEMRENNADL
jgi:predicted nucleotidyltransferase